jgi:hypothetical protein
MSLMVERAGRIFALKPGERLFGGDVLICPTPGCDISGDTVLKPFSECGDTPPTQCKPGICTRKGGHDGPCNGYPRVEFYGLVSREPYYCFEAGAVATVPIRPSDLHDKAEKVPLPWPLRHKTSSERKAEPIYSGVLRYFPDALAAVARVSKAGNVKHNPGEPLHWSRDKSTDQLDCAVRHVLTPEVIDPETGEPELANAVWRGLAELQLLEERRNRERGVRSYSGVE